MIIYIHNYHHIPYIIKKTKPTVTFNIDIGYTQGMQIDITNPYHGNRYFRHK